MKAFLLTLTLIMSLFAISQSDKSCFRELKKDRWNYALCLDSVMGLDESENTRLMIKSYETVVGATLTRDLSVELEYNYENETPREIWESKSANTLLPGYTLLEQDEQSIKSLQYPNYIINQVFENDKEEKWCIATAIVVYKTQYYVFRSLGINEENEALGFLTKVLNRSSFYGAPILHNDKAQKEQFLTNLVEARNSDAVLQSILFTTDLLLEVTPDNEKEAEKQGIPQIEMMIDSWHKKAFDYQREMNKFKEVGIESSFFKRDNTQPNMTAYEATINFNCAGEGKAYRLICMEVNGAIYLARIQRS